jgi:hypothetical protein
MVISVKVVALLTHEEFTKVVVTLWAVWSARHKAIHEIFQSPFHHIWFRSNYLVELDIAQFIKKKRSAPQAPSVGASVGAATRSSFLLPLDISELSLTALTNRETQMFWRQLPYAA